MKDIEYVYIYKVIRGNATIPIYVEIQNKWFSCIKECISEIPKYIWFPLIWNKALPGFLVFCDT